MTKEKLIEFSNSFTQAFNELLMTNGYTESSIILSRIDCQNSEFPNMPSVETIWINNNIHQQFVFRAYENQTSYFEINKIPTQKSILINDLLPEINYKTEDKESNYEQYLYRVHEAIVSSELLNVIAGKTWMDTPFNWQNQK